MNKRIYLDYAAATPLDNDIFDEMKPFFLENYGNPSSIYQFAQKSRTALDQARKNIADVLMCKTSEIYFTSGGTEANNWVIFGLSTAYPQKKHIITTVIEHHSVLDPIKELERRGYEVTYLSVNNEGFIDLKGLEKVLRPDTLLVSIMYGNNEIGTVEDITQIAEIVKKKGILFHTDACQAAGSLPLDVHTLNVDLMTINSGKIYGPKGAGALYIKEGILITPLLYGGGQEHRLRSGTENVPALVGFGNALKKAEVRRNEYVSRLVKLRNMLIKALYESFSKVILNGPKINFNLNLSEENNSEVFLEKRLPNNINVTFPGVDAESLIIRLDMEGFCVSTGSACSSGSVEPSHVLLGIGLSKELAKNSVRITLGRGTTEEDLKRFVDVLKKILSTSI